MVVRLVFWVRYAMKVTSIIIGLLAAVSVAWASMGMRDYVTIHAANHSFYVPKQNLPNLGYLGWIYTIPGLDRSEQSFIFEFSSDEIEAAVPGYIKTDRNIDQKVIGSVSILTAGEVAHAMTDHPYYPLWTASHGYEDREVIFDEKLGLYKVYSSKTYRTSWDVLNTYPDKTKPVPPNKYSFWVAHCSGGIKTQDGEEIVTCSGQFLLGDISVDYSFSGKNIQSRERIMAFLQQRILQWQQPAQTP